MSHAQSVIWKVQVLLGIQRYHISWCLKYNSYNNPETISKKANKYIKVKNRSCNYYLSWWAGSKPLSMSKISNPSQETRLFLQGRENYHLLNCTQGPRMLIDLILYFLSHCGWSNEDNQWKSEEKWFQIWCL